MVSVNNIESEARLNSPLPLFPLVQPLESLLERVLLKLLLYWEENLLYELILLWNVFKTIFVFFFYMCVCGVVWCDVVGLRLFF
jgi:hypothetical protein